MPIASLDALIAVREAVGPDPVVLFDSGSAGERTCSSRWRSARMPACWADRTCTDSPWPEPTACAR